MSNPVRGVVAADGSRLVLGPDERKKLAALAGKPVDLFEHKAKRSSKQNRYYFGVVVKLFAEHCGYEPDDMHETLAMKFLRIEDCPVTGVPRRKRTPACNTKDFADYVDQCVRLAAEYGVYVPDPGVMEES